MAARRHSVSDGAVLFAKAAAAALLLAVALPRASSELYRRGNLFEIDTIESGEMLLHGFHFGTQAENFHLPLATVSGALITGHSPFPPGVWRAASAAVAILLILALGVQLGSVWYGLLGAALLLFSASWIGVAGKHVSWHGHWGHLQTFHGLLLLMTAGLCARHARAPTRANAAAAALTLAATLLYRSTIVFFPPLLALRYWLSAPRGRRDGRQAALLGLAPYLVLLPWIAMNAVAYGSFVPLEKGEAAPIIIGGVLGSVQKDFSHVPAELGLGGTGTGAALAWAVPRVLAHPLDYALGYLRRLRFVALMSPALFLLAALAFYRHRRRPEFQALGLLCAYFILIHCFMSFLLEYFDPLWPLLAVAAAALPFPPPRGEPRPPERRVADAVLDAGLAGALLLVLFVFRVLVGYAYAVTHDDEAARRARIERAILRHPDRGAFYALRGMMSFEDGDAAAAARDLDEAARLEPDDDAILRRSAWIGLYRSSPAAFDSWLAGSGGTGKDAEALLLRIDGFLRGGRAADARREAARLRARAPAKTRLGGVDLSLLAFLNDLCLRLSDVPDLAPTCLDAAVVSFDAGDAASVRRFLAAAGPARLDPPQRRAAARLYYRLKDFPRAAVLLDALIAGSPRDGGLLLDRAEVAAGAGDAGAARRFLARARDAGLGADDLRREALLDLSGDPLERAAAAISAGRREQALAALAEAEAVNPADSGRWRIASYYQELGEHARAASAFDVLVARSPRDPRLRFNRAVSAQKLGRSADALADLALARSLGADESVLRRMPELYRALGERARAAELLDGLLVRAPKDAELLVERAELAAESGDRAAALAALARTGGLAVEPALGRRIARLHSELDAPVPAAAAESEAKRRHRQALQLQERKDYAAASAILEELARAEPANAEYHSDLGLCRYLSGREQDAVSELTQALRLDPGLVAASLTLGTIQTARGRTEEALRVYDAALARPGLVSENRRLLSEGRAAAAKR